MRAKISIAMPFVFAVLLFQNCSSGEGGQSPDPAIDAQLDPSTAQLQPGDSWYWQLSGPLDLSRNEKIFDIDLFDADSASIASLHAKGKRVICYFSAGSFEPWRSDAASFPANVIGATMAGWPNERWLDIRSANLRPILNARLALAKAKGCDGVEPDNVDGYANASGFPLNAADQTQFLRWIAESAHSRGLLVGLKNTSDLVDGVVSSFDFAVVEECFAYHECEAYRSFSSRGKPVLNAEYSNYSNAICSQAHALKFSTAFFDLSLSGRMDACR